ncbi:helix-turn-helix domain-containing protein [Allocoleopsis sp.]|uniref:helix-turn-helix domain-containing protein n=1 Tax=Allocoleopsis sp. TaxID=3088169 RepID=UPI002FD0349E
MKENKRHFPQEQVEKLEELGSRLRQFRTEQSIPLEEVAAQTRIQARLLNAIEEGRLDELPEPVYIKGFIKRFAEALGLNGAEFASAFPTGSALQFVKPAWQYLPAAQLRPMHLYLLYVCLVIGAVSGLSLLVRRSAMEGGMSRAEDYPSQVKQFPSPSPSTRPKPLQKLEPTKAAEVTQRSQDGKPVQVRVTLKAQSWLRIVADGKTEFEGTLPEGTKRTWVADKRLVVRAGNAGGVLVEFNKESAKQMGAPYEVQEISFAANPSS